MHLRFVTATIATIFLTPVAVSAATADEQALLNMEARFAKAFVAKDYAAVAGMYADDYHGRGSSSMTLDSKTSFLAPLKSRKLVFTSMVNHDLHAYVHGDTGYVLGADDEKTMYDGKDMSGTFMWLDVYQKRGGRWQLIASQSAMPRK